MKNYIGCKIIKAELMDKRSFEISYRNKLYSPGSMEDLDKDGCPLDGYLVAYPNNDNSVYYSWSPKKVFEKSYRKITKSEISIINNEI